MVEAGTNLGMASGVYIKSGIEPTQPPSPPPPKLLGPFEALIKFSGMDCSKTRKDNIRSFRGIISAIIAALILLLLITQTVVYMSIDETPFSIGWAESSVYGFISATSVISAICIILWTKNNFVSQFEDALSRVRSMRLSTNSKIDDYTVFHRKSAVFILPIFVFKTSTAFYSSITHRYYQNDNSTFYSNSPIFVISPLIEFIGSISISLSLITYVTINTAINREIKHFNKELVNSARFQQLTLPQVLNNYSKRHSDIIQLVQMSNKNLEKFVTIIPLFTLISFVNSVFIIGSFSHIIPTFMTCLMYGWAILSIGISIAIFQPISKIQENIHDTAEILMHDDVLQTCGDDQMHHTYRVTLDRCLHSRTGIVFLNAISINTKTFNWIIFAVSNIPAIMIIFKKLQI